MSDAAIEFRDVTYKTAQGRVLLDHISASVPAGTTSRDSWPQRVREDDFVADCESDARSDLGRGFAGGEAG